MVGVRCYGRSRKTDSEEEAEEEKKKVPHDRGPSWPIVPLLFPTPCYSIWGIGVSGEGGGEGDDF